MFVVQCVQYITKLKCVILHLQGVDSEKPTTDSTTTVTSSDSKVDTLNGEVPTDNPQQIIDNDKVSEL